MKKHLISTVAVLAILAVVLVSFGRAQDRNNQRQGMRERLQNMSQEERAAFLQRMRERGFRGRRMSREEQEKAVKTIEEQVAKLKASLQVEMPQGGFQNLSEEERNKLRQSFTDRRNALQAIIAQVAQLEGRTQPEQEGARFIIINTADLKPIQEAAVKEKATETSQLLERLMARGARRGRFGGGQRGQRPPRQRQQQ
ncbi:MAG: hypothetical protein P8Z79_18605 [Sedimentisphaerales bacterium]|jgi:hypothetical protein